MSRGDLCAKAERSARLIVAFRPRFPATRALLQEWQKLPRVILNEYCQRQGRPRPVLHHSHTQKQQPMYRYQPDEEDDDEDDGDDAGAGAGAAAGGSGGDPQWNIWKSSAGAAGKDGAPPADAPPKRGRFRTRVVLPDAKRSDKVRAGAGTREGVWYCDCTGGSHARHMAT